MPEGPLCGCGRRGCLEAVASRLSIAANAAKAAYRGEAPYVKEKGGTDITDIRSSVLADAILAGDKVIEQLVREAARQIGIAVAGIVHILSPDVIVLGGGLVEAMPELRVGTGRRRRPARRCGLGSSQIRGDCSACLSVVILIHNR
jgi:glucokinase